MWESTSNFHGDLEWNWSQGGNMVICFNRLIRHGNDPLHLPLPLPWSLPPRPMGLNLGMYKIWDGHGFGTPHTIWAAEQGNYDLMLLMETNIPDAVYCRNHLGYDIVRYKATLTTAGVGHGGLESRPRRSWRGGLFSQRTSMGWTWWAAKLFLETNKRR